MNKTSSLTPAIRQITESQQTECAYTGIYNSHKKDGTYLCRQCGLTLFRSQHKFHSGCGWPSFDEAIDGAVVEKPDQDGRRTEIICAACDAHLGHVFRGEQFTTANTRHCVNSLSIDFVDDLTVNHTEEAIYAAGCFWGVEYYFKRLAGVLKTEVGYSGGKVADPSYNKVCDGDSGHLEVIRVVYDSSKLDYGALTRYFFEIHDPTQANGQGPDIGEQYLSAIFYYNDTQQEIARAIIRQLTDKHIQVVTKLLPVAIFWPAEEYHQSYYAKSAKTPYCHHYVKRF